MSDSVGRTCGEVRGARGTPSPTACRHKYEIKLNSTRVGAINFDREASACWDGDKNCDYNSPAQGDEIGSLVLIERNHKGRAASFKPRQYMYDSG